MDTIIEEPIGKYADVTDYVANGSFASLKENVIAKDETDYAVMVRLTDFNHGWKGPFRYVTKESFDFLSKSVVVPGDLIIANIGANAGTPFLASDLGKPMTLGPNAVLVKSDISDYLYYYFASHEGKHKLNSIIGGGAQPKFNKTEFRGLKISVPSAPIRKNIVGILSSLDNKIELNRKMNETLEEMGHTLFRHWFVNFEFPWDFKKNEFSWEGKPYKSSGGKMVESELGEIPKGWSVGGVLDVANKLSLPYKCEKKDLDPNGEVPIIDQGASGIYGYTSRQADFIASREDPVILFTNHTCNFWYIDFPFCAIQNVIPMRGKRGYDTEFVYFITKKSIAFNEYKGHWPEFETKRFVIPQERIIKEFSKTAQISLESISSNNRETQTLIKIRDLLLPRLMSGKLRIRV
jgi:type I restriction enzyme, S subunit